ncbi:tRNA-splicing endonuclease subunit Sen34 [Cryptococcus neoformans Tu259-1]|uniref:tRNA-splicing endonuclease subunit Sen34 n=1 Tax=Cryptococcus neoformans Tu259-1 TaxID=1230072 RepID=A0A854Q6A1_CRYNE|nr:tRNA-splicing endonuclease subunit Sen34 [Cryptococcus neoformans var. grubii AD1-83a]OXG13085.1 tRNA-splicing endonuclease subunit Sen34 [Cryptococcus neoformans var. grubii Tu259-1]OXG49724.1 tRNA-splicing endonuclease subunit Sen34 [Cryptococcus neoformans var. grubii MW-RSA1955]OXG54003.1 tRNA-splicing endonuclease subunit Sen34 [Cryptococcus neoformans var. grubii CHC193]OXG58783.1 tRNA-splicing endonuclease subunit Sen34 [Cryptococcus neoformans var. grubii c8]OXH03451.1 tRNA-splicing
MVSPPSGTHKVSFSVLPNPHTQADNPLIAAATLHCVHNVSGLRAGTLPGVAQQNGFLGLPLTLMQEETAYLVTQGIAHLVSLDPSPSPPSEETVKAHTAARIARLKALEEKTREAEAKRQEESRKAFDKGGEKARLKREARARAQAEKARESGEGLFEEGINAKENITAPIAGSPAKTKTKTKATETKYVPTPGHFHIVPSHPVLSQHPSGSQSITSLPHPLFPFPTTPRQHALLGVFSKLQSLSYRVGLGPRFGGEWLIYPGDYLRYHAHFTSQVIVRDEPIKPTEIVAWGRLGTGTKKAGLICCWDDGKREEGQDNQEEEKEEDVEFYSLEWANFG